MFTFFECYMPETWDGLVRRGFINKNTGIRFNMNAGMNDCSREFAFNTLAARGGRLYRILEETRCPFYIDRFQGGTEIINYPYDKELLRTYREMLGDNFFGLQMHEWMSNYWVDLWKLQDLPSDRWTEENITSLILEKFGCGYKKNYLHLEAMTAREYAETGRPDNYSDFLRIAENMLADRQKETDGMLISADNSWFMPYPIELRNGIRRFMPEIGWQSNDTRVQLAYARGMARGAGIPFGAYYESWGGVPFSECVYQRDRLNEWRRESTIFESTNENGGSSRSLQDRILHYAYMAGASFLSEEWGMCNTFYDWEDFELSPYGTVKKNFRDFTEKYRDIGHPIVPMAAVLPAELPVLEGVRKTEAEYCTFPMAGSFAEKVDLSRKGLRRLFCESAPVIGDDNGSLINCRIPDAIDIVNDGYFDSDDYEYLIDLTGDSAFAAKYQSKLCEIGDVPALLDSLLPCRVEGNGMVQYTRTDDGTTYLQILNNSGAFRNGKDGEWLDHTADETLCVLPASGKLEMLEGNGSLHFADGKYYVFVPAGGRFFGRC